MFCDPSLKGSHIRPRRGGELDMEGDTPSLRVPTSDLDSVIVTVQ